jgi:hypothetical protein
MEELVFRALYRQFMFFSENGAEEIIHPSIAISEASKCCSRPRLNVTEAFYAFEEHGLIERVDKERFAFRMTKKGIDQNKVEELLKTVTTT